MLHLRGDGVTPAQLAEVAASLGIPTPVAGYCGHEVVIVGNLNEASLRDALSRPAVACMEWKDGAGAIAAPLAALERNDGLYLSLTTGSAFRLQPAHSFRQAVEIRYDLTLEVAESIELALHEAVANAVMHGNLNMAGMLKQDPQQLAAFCAVLEERLAIPALWHRRVHLWALPGATKVTFCVEDEGSGYRPSPPSADPDRKSGRGLPLITALAGRVWADRQGRRLTMEFRR